MIYNAFEKTIIKLGFFGANLRLPFMPFIYFIGHIASLSLIVYPYACKYNIFIQLCKYPRRIINFILFFRCVLK